MVVESRKVEEVVNEENEEMVERIMYNDDASSSHSEKTNTRRPLTHSPIHTVFMTS
jgi:hypothetical protein